VLLVSLTFSRTSSLFFCSIPQALRVDGMRRHELARAGITPPRPAEPRSVHVHSLSVIECEPPFVTLSATVSGGTYIRSLARDIGVHLGVQGGSVVELRRTRAGPLTLSQCTWRACCFSLIGPPFVFACRARVYVLLIFCLRLCFNVGVPLTDDLTVEGVVEAVLATEPTTTPM
jgi:hypothetical protein